MIRAWGGSRAPDAVRHRMFRSRSGLSPETAY
jgi:hypothetical protein